MPNEKGRRSTGRARHGMGALGTVVALVVVGGLIVSILLPSMCRTGERANRAKCAWNLHQIGAAIAPFADGHGGRYPASLAELEIGAGLSADVFVCPSGHDVATAAKGPTGIAADVAASAAGGKHCLSYAYAGHGMTARTVGPMAVVVTEPVADHDNQGGNVLFGDGHAEWCSNGSWPTVIAGAVAGPSTRNGVRP